MRFDSCHDRLFPVVISGGRSRFQVLYRLEKLLRLTPCGFSAGSRSEELFKPIQNLKPVVAVVVVFAGLGDGSVHYHDKDHHRCILLWSCGTCT